MRLLPYKHRSQIAGGAAVFAAAVAVVAYFAVSGNGEVPVASTNPSSGASTQFIAGSRAISSSSVKASSSASRSAKPKASATPSKSSRTSAAKIGSSAGDTPIAQSGSSNSSRSPYTWPFSWDSIWNIPNTSTATYTPAGIKSSASYEDSGAPD